MKRISDLVFIVGIVFLVMNCESRHEQQVVNKPGSFGLFPNYLFPTKTPDRIILNLTNDPTHSVAVNWRTDTTVENSIVQVAIATHGPEFVKNTWDIQGNKEFLTHKPENDPEVSATYHSAIITDLVPGEKYVYRVGSDQGWSEWFQIQMPEPEKKISFVYFGDAQNNLKSMWSRVIRQAYGSI
ncbi:MAG: fibronectin type III domain-containing protein, partial [Cyclobacteriaceae bacterium]|nr:fibronectin type III domain-containing protein [Cyclobacteriaceae bacterium]